MVMTDVLFGFDSADPLDQKWIEDISEYKKTRARGVPHQLVNRVKETKVGRVFAIPLAKMMTADKPYSAKDICGLLGDGWSPKRVASKLNTLGRPETKHGGARIFGRPVKGRYTLTQPMKDALLSKR